MVQKQGQRESPNKGFPTGPRICQLNQQRTQPLNQIPKYKAVPAFIPTCLCLPHHPPFPISIILALYTVRIRCSRYWSLPAALCQCCA